MNTEKESKPTPGAWRYWPKNGHAVGSIQDSLGNHVAYPLTDEYGRQIVTAVNCHEEMLAALEGIESTYVFLDSLTAGHEPQHTNTMIALSKIQVDISKARGKA